MIDAIADYWRAVLQRRRTRRLILTDCPVSSVCEYISEGHSIKLGGTEAQNLLAMNCASYFPLENGFDGVCAALKDACTCTVPELPGQFPESWGDIGSLDLISHSATEETYLRISEWTIDDSDSTTERFLVLKHYLDVLRSRGAYLRDVRLLGCATATTPKGVAALGRIAAALGENYLVWGTNSIIDHRNFSYRRFNRIVNGRNFLFPYFPSMGPLDLDLAAAFVAPFVSAATFPSTASVMNIIEHVDLKKGKEFMGLLSSPLKEIEMSDGTRMQALLNWCILRVCYRDGREVCFPVSDRESFVKTFEATVAQRNPNA